MDAPIRISAISPPYVVVAHSYGGFVGRLFAATYLGEQEKVAQAGSVGALRTRAEVSTTVVGILDVPGWVGVQDPRAC
jgi:pimeloyl-ACP methyl ester carboxylesterase